MVDVVAAVIQGMLQGFGTAIGTYLAAKYAIDHVESLKKKFKKS